MGAIAGWVSKSANPNQKPTFLQDMSNALTHRGASECLYQDSTAALCARANSNAQIYAMHHQGDLYLIAITCNIFNLQKIKSMLLSKNYACGDSAQEIILLAYITWGAQCLSKIKGSFAFVIWQKNANKLFAARDKAGICPLFYYQNADLVIFSSELASLLKHPAVCKKVDTFGLNQLILLGPGRACGSGIISGVKELEPGQYFTFFLGVFSVKTYWQLTALPHNDNLQQTVEKTRHLITTAAAEQITSDTACFLSGGLDSSILSYLAAKELKQRNKNLQVYSIEHIDNDKFFAANSFQPTQDDEFINLMTTYLGASHQKILLDANDLAGQIPLATIRRNLPGMGDIDSSLLIACQNIAQKQTTIFSGECADEIFGGYPWYHNKDVLFKQTFPWSDSLDLRTSLFNIGSNDSSRDFVQAEYEKIIAKTTYLDDDSKFERRQRQMFVLNYYCFMQNLIERTDRMSAHSALDVRIPFCDIELVEYAYNMPWHLKALGGREKGIVRQAFSGVLPQAIIERKKSPFPKTYNPQFLQSVRQSAIAVVEKGGIVASLINKDFFNKLVAGDYQSATPWYGQLMRLPQIFAYIVSLDVFFTSFNLSL